MEGSMKRNFAGLLVGCGLLAGCSGPSLIDDHRSPSPTPTTAETTPGGGGTDAAAFVFDSGVLEIGDFDPYTLGDNIFDPCTEISPEEFAAAGFDNVEPMPEEYRGLARGLSVCDFSVSGEDDFDISNMRLNRRQIEHESTLLDEFKSEILPEIFVYGTRESNNNSCFAQVDTVRGGLSIGVVSLPGYSDLKADCMRALHALEQLYSTNNAH